MIKQPDYNKKDLKRKYQLSFFKKIQNKEKFIGLCGPTPEGYLKQIKAAGFRNIVLVDNDTENLNQNLQLFRKLNAKSLKINGICGDINKMLSEEAFYDLDYCKSIINIFSILPKIFKLKELTLTIALRPISEEQTLRTIKSHTSREFMYRVYREGGTPMMICYFPPIKK